MDIDDVSAVATRMEDVREVVRTGKRGWYLGGRLVAREERPGVLLVRCGFAERERLFEAAPRVFSVTPPMEAHMKVLVDLDEVTPELLEDVLGAAADLQRAAP
jgi:hypothetical protein